MLLMLLSHKSANGRSDQLDQQQNARHRCQGGGAGDDQSLFAEESLIEEYDAPDLDTDIGTTNLTASQRHILANKTPLETKSNFLNAKPFRDAYLKEKVTAK